MWFKDVSILSAGGHYFNIVPDYCFRPNVKSYIDEMRRDM